MPHSSHTSHTLDPVTTHTHSIKFDHCANKFQDYIKFIYFKIYNALQVAYSLSLTSGYNATAAKRMMLLQQIMATAFAILILLPNGAHAFSVQYMPGYRPENQVGDPLCNTICADYRTDMPLQTCLQICNYFNQENVGSNAMATHNEAPDTSFYPEQPQSELPNKRDYFEDDVGNIQPRDFMNVRKLKDYKDKLTQRRKRLPGQCLNQCIDGGMKFYQCAGLCQR